MIYIKQSTKCLTAKKSIVQSETSGGKKRKNCRVMRQKIKIPNTFFKISFEI